MMTEHEGTQVDCQADELTPEERLVEVAAILARAVLRVRAARVRQDTLPAAVPPARRPLPPLSLSRMLTQRIADRDVFWTDRADQSPLVRELRERNLELIVWLELQGRDDAAAKIEQAWVAMKEAWWEFDRQRERAGSDARVDSRCRRSLKSLIASAACLNDTLEKVAGEVPESVWDGFLGA